MKEVKVLIFLNQISLLLLETEKTYKDYHENGKTFKYAKILRCQNTKLLHLLEHEIELLEDNQQVKVRELMEHLNVWNKIWDKEYREKNPQRNDIFYFHNSNNFPRKTVNSLMEYKAKLENKVKTGPVQV